MSEISVTKRRALAISSVKGDRADLVVCAPWSSKVTEKPTFQRQRSGGLSNGFFKPLALTFERRVAGLYYDKCLKGLY